jgi:hypothetical protein
MGNDKYPRPEGRLPPEARKRFPDSNKYFLRHVVGDGIIPEPRDAIGEDRLPAPCYKRVECLVDLSSIECSKRFLFPRRQGGLIFHIQQ